MAAWVGGYQETWLSWPFLVLDAIVCVGVGGLTMWYWGLAVIVFGMICVWMGATARAPIMQRNEARLMYKELADKYAKPKLFDVLCRTTSLGLPINRTLDGHYQASSVEISLYPLVIVHRGERITITNLIMSLEIRFIRKDKGWQTTNAIQVKPAINPLGGPRTQIKPCSDIIGRKH